MNPDPNPPPGTFVPHPELPPPTATTGVIDRKSVV